MAEASSPSGKFVWYEYMGNDLQAAVDFYTAVVGWSAKDAGMGFDFAYQILSIGSTRVTGMMNVPEEAKAMGAKPSWMGYVWVEDVDKALPKLTAAGGKVYKAPADIPGVGRLRRGHRPGRRCLHAVQGCGRQSSAASAARDARLGRLARTARRRRGPRLRVLFRPVRLDERARPTTWGRWASTTFSTPATASRGGIFTKTPQTPSPFWLYYFNVDAIDPAVERVQGARRKRRRRADGDARRPMDPARARSARCDVRARRAQTLRPWRAAAPAPGGGRQPRGKIRNSSVAPQFEFRRP